MSSIIQPPCNGQRDEEDNKKRWRHVFAFSPRLDKAADGLLTLPLWSSRFDRLRQNRFDVDTAILHGFNGIGDLDQLAGGGFRFGLGSMSGKFLSGINFGVVGGPYLFGDADIDGIVIARSAIEWGVSGRRSTSHISKRRNRDRDAIRHPRER